MCPGIGASIKNSLLLYKNRPYRERKHRSGGEKQKGSRGIRRGQGYRLVFQFPIRELEGEKWIADVGFGGQTLTAPIHLVSDLVQTTPHGEYRLLQEGDDWVLQFNHHQHWQPMYRFDLCEQQQSDYVMGNFWSAHWPQSHFRHHLLMCRHLPDGGKLTLTNFHFTHYENGHAVEQRNLPDVASLYAVMQEQFGLGVDDAKHGFTVDELALVMAAFDTHPEAGK
ncbi:N-hydroxyarylamine O-acetyltransferase [Shigella sonnei]|nr:N-hydroxyarylamine O-acetyltransferase [Shigella sonnei]CSQ82292.1 N-hydroxyarylamine O-acetyltransferase [Shigella sonnei]